MSQAITRTVLVPYSAQEMYDLVCDVARYREFLPGCISSEVVASGEAELIGRMTAWMDAHPEAVILTPKVMNPDGTEQFLPKGLAKLDAPVRAVLRSGLAQAKYMQVPMSAAVNESV